MLPDDIRDQIENIAAGNVIERGADHCTAIRNLLCAGATAGRTVKVDFEGKQRIKEAQALFIEQYAKDNGLWLEEPSFVDFLARGGEEYSFFQHCLYP
jgi:hypothetical protein